MTKKHGQKNYLSTGQRRTACILAFVVIGQFPFHHSLSASSTAVVVPRSGSIRPSKDVCEPKVRKLKCRDMEFSGDWSGMNFSGADLRGSIFKEGSKFVGTNFSKAKLSGADFRSSRQKSAPIGDDYDPNYAVCRNGVCPSAVDLRNANFSNADLSDVMYGGALVSGANFSGAWMPDASFGPVGAGSTLDMRGTNFRDAYMEDANFYRAILTNVNFTKTRLSRAMFIDSDLTLARFEGAMLARARFISSVIKRTNFKNAITSKMVLPNGCRRLNGPTTCK
jgi:uncharacterized protein YjbI with pentapeptide repeats